MAGYKDMEVAKTIWQDKKAFKLYYIVAVFLLLNKHFPQDG